MRLSHSQVDKLLQCGQKWKYHYVDRLRGQKIPSPLFLGSALDEAFSWILLNKKRELTDIELDLLLKSTAGEVFERKMLQVESNGETVQLAQSPFADYYASDFTPELLLPKHEILLQSLEPTYKLADFLDFHQSCKEQMKAKRKLLDDDQILFNYMTWLTLVEKGHLMIDAYKTQVLPQIEEVFEIQKSISIKNEDGDEITGAIDFTASFEDAPGVKYTCDNKSSSKPYTADSVKESEQLACYSHAENNDKAAYVVVEKKLFKKGDIIRTSVIKDTISEETFQKTFDKFEKACYTIQRGQFEKNWDSCFAFGRVCEYYKLCKYDSFDGLIKLEQNESVPTAQEENV